MIPLKRIPSLRYSEIAYLPPFRASIARTFEVAWVIARVFPAGYPPDLESILIDRDTFLG